MKKSFYKFLLSIIGLASASLAFAANTGPGVSTDLSGWMPPSTDLTGKLFNMIYGDVYGLFGTGSNTIAGAMFGIFNSAVLLVGLCLVAYIIFGGVLHTAASGDILGKSWSGTVMPLRASLGVAMTLPSLGGYSLVQALVMWVALLGVGIADNMWNGITGYMVGGGVITTKPASMQINSLAGNILKSSTCMVAINKFDTDGGRAPLTISLTTEIPPGMAQNNTSYKVVNFGQNGECGSLRFKNTFVDQSNTNVGLNGQTTFDAAVASMQQAHLNATLKMIGEINPQAVNIVDGGAADPSVLSNASLEYSAAITAAGDAAFSGVDKSIYDAFIAQNKQDGWLLAGTYYYQIARMGDQSTQAVNDIPSWSGPALSNEPAAVSNAVSPFVQAASATGSVANGGLGSINEKAITPSDDGAISSFVKELLGKIVPIMNEGPFSTAVIQGSADIFSGGGMVNPLIRLKSVGDWCINVFDATLIGAMVIAFGSGTAISAASLLSAGPGFMAAFMVLMIPLGILLIAAILAGFALSVWLPLAPYAFWTLGVAGYFVMITEALIGAPLWAIIHCAPSSGEDLVGQGARGYTILLDLLLRPVLMLMGLMFSMSLMTVMGALLLYTFVPMYKIVNADTVAGFIIPIVTIFIFAFLFLKIVHRSLKMINEIPHEVMNWIGGGSHAFNDDPAHEGNTHVGAIMAHVRNAGQAGAGAVASTMKKGVPKMPSGEKDGGNDSENAKHIGAPSRDNQQV